MMSLFSILLSLSVSSIALAEESFDIGAVRRVNPVDLLTKYTCAFGDAEPLLPVSGQHQQCPHNQNGSTASLEAIATPGPWTEVPHCTDRSNASDAFCVFTDSTFARGRGISIVTKPAIAKDFLKLRGFTDPKVMTRIPISQFPPPFVITPLPGRGMGVIANRTVERGDLIMAYTTTTIFHADTFGHPEDGEEPNFPLIHVAVDRLPQSSRAGWLDLAAHFEGNDAYNERINTNSFSEEFSEEEHYIVVPEISRFNHDCRPNAMYYFDGSTLTQNVHAARTIHAGEEITITYLDPLQTRKTRLAAAKRSWGFDCSCSLCTQPPAMTRESDRRIRAIVEMAGHLGDWNETSKGTPEMAELLVSLYEQERLYASIADAYKLAALAYNAVGNEWMAVKYAMRAVEIGLIHSGPRDEDVADMRELIIDPREHSSWMLRRGDVLDKS